MCSAEDKKAELRNLYDSYRKCLKDGQTSNAQWIYNQAVEKFGIYWLDLAKKI